jgi:putative transposase
MTCGPAVRRRRSIRLKGYDYAQAGAYFITICTHNRQPFFGEIVRAGLSPAQMEFNQYGGIAYDQWQKIPERFENIELDQFVIMPNHIHAILFIIEPATGTARVGASPTPTVDETENAQVGADDPVGAGFTPALDETNNARVGTSPTPTQIGQPQNPIRTTIGDVVGAYKSLVANECLKIYKAKNEFLGKLWQRNYYEHIIRDEKSYNAIAEYILNNPAQWELDELYPGGTI